MQQPLPTEDAPARSTSEAVAAAEWMLQLVVDSSGRILRVESTGEEVLGRPRGELLGHTLDEIVISDTDPCRGGCLSGSSRGHGVVSSPGGEHRLVWSALPLDECGLPDHFVLSVADLTALERSRATGDEMFRALAATTAAAMFIHRDDVLLECNAAAERLTGYSREALLHRDFWDLLHPGLRLRARQQSAARLRGETVPTHNEVRLVAADGRSVWVDFTATVIRLQGEPVVLGTAFDITARKLAQRDLRHSERRFRALIEHSSDAVVVIDSEGRFKYAAPAVRGGGYEPEELVGRIGFDLVHPDDRTACADAVRQLLERPQETVTITYRLRHADGSWRWMEGVGTNLLAEPDIGGIVFNHRDITDRRDAEERLRASEERFALAVAGANDGIWDWDLATGGVYLSPRLRELIGVPADGPVSVEQLGMSVHPDDAAAVQRAWAALVRGRSSFFQSEHRVRRPDGTLRWVAARGASIRAADGTPVRLVGSLSDIDERKLREQEALQRQSELAHLHRLRVVGEMASGLAHEINQPLAAIANFASGCIRRLEQQGVSAEIRQAMERISAEALRAGKIVHGLKRFVRREPPRQTEENVNDLVRDATQLIGAEARDHAIEISVDLAAGLPRVGLDSIQIEQVIINLLRNGIEAIEPPGGRLIVRTTLTTGPSIEVSVCDSGRGISPSQAERIFEPFYSSKPNGLGMGLSISRAIVEAHGGQLWAAVNPGSGTTVAFRLPLGP